MRSGEGTKVGQPLLGSRHAGTELENRVGLPT